VSGWSSTTRTRTGIGSLIGRPAPAEKGDVRRVRENEFEAWLRDELVLAMLLGGAIALFAATSIRDTYRLPAAHLALNTAVVLACVTVAVLAAIRYSVESRRSDLLLSAGFFAVSLSTLAFEVG